MGWAAFCWAHFLASELWAVLPAWRINSQRVLGLGWAGAELGLGYSQSIIYNILMDINFSRNECKEHWLDFVCLLFDGHDVFVEIKKRNSMAN